MRLESLTGMRFLATVPIVLIHVGSNFFGPPWLRSAFGYGYIGVTFFFVLSGFVLTWSSDHLPARRFWWLRFARIWPAQALVAIVALLVIQQGRPPSWPGGAADVLLVQSWWPNAHVYFGGNGVSWSLSCEAFFYLLFPALALTVRPLKRRGLIAISGCVVALLVAGPAAGEWLGLSGQLKNWLFFILPGYRLLEFLLGMVLARAVQQGLRMPRPGVAVVAGGLTLFGLVALLVWLTSTYGWYPARPWMALLVLPVFAGLVVTGATADLQGTAGWLASRPFRWLGAISFALYLVHQPLFRITQAWGWWSARYDLLGVAAFVAFFIVAAAVAAALHHLVEKPLERRLRAMPVGMNRPSTSYVRIST